MTSDTERLGRLLQEVRIGEWVAAHYEHASICRHPERGSYEIPNPVRDYWKNGLIDRAGFPRRALHETTLFGRPVQVMDFDEVIVYLDPATDAVFHVPSKEDRETAMFRAIPSALVGRWDDDEFEQSVVGIHAAVLHTNELLFWTYRDDGVSQNVVEKGAWSVVNLSTRQVVVREESDRNQFCSGQCLLGDGNVLVVGGDRYAGNGNGNELNSRTVRLFKPGGKRTPGEWEVLQDLAIARWYPTLVSYGSTTGIVVAGRDRAKTEQPGFYGTSVRSALFLEEDGTTGAVSDFDSAFGLRSGDMGDTYPFVFVLPTDQLFVHLGDLTRLVPLKTLNFQSAHKATDPRGASTYDQQGTAVLLPLRPADKYRARVMLIGGGLPGGGEHSYPLGMSKCVIMDTSETAPQWKPAKMLHDLRLMGDAVLLPDGKVLVVNGVRAGSTKWTHEKDARLAPEIYDPASDQWTELAPMKTARAYHATALLLPDGRVMTTGTDRTWNKKPNPQEQKAKTNIEVFSPPYLFKGSRPTIQSAPRSARYGETVFVGTDDYYSVKSAVLIRNGSCTHSFNPDQRFVEVEILERRLPQPTLSLARVEWKVRSFAVTALWPNLIVVGGLQLRMPPTELVAPPGYYMLFLVSDRGVPSVARFIRLGGQGMREPWSTFGRVEGRGAGR